jgi:hypothetical protein
MSEYYFASCYSLAKVVFEGGSWLQRIDELVFANLMSGRPTVCHRPASGLFQRNASAVSVAVSFSTPG